MKAFINSKSLPMTAHTVYISGIVRVVIGPAARSYRFCLSGEFVFIHFVVASLCDQ